METLGGTLKRKNSTRRECMFANVRQRNPMSYKCRAAPHHRHIFHMIHAKAHLIVCVLFPAESAPFSTVLEPRLSSLEGV